MRVLGGVGLVPKSLTSPSYVLRTRCTVFIALLTWYASMLRLTVLPKQLVILIRFNLRLYYSHSYNQR